MQRAHPFAIEGAVEKGEHGAHIIAPQVTEMRGIHVVVRECLARPVHGRQIVGALLIDTPLLHRGMHGRIFHLDHEAVVAGLLQVLAGVGKFEREVHVLRAVFALPRQGVNVALRLEELAEGDWRHAGDVRPLSLVLQDVDVVRGFIGREAGIDEVERLEEVRGVEVARLVGDAPGVGSAPAVAEWCKGLFHERRRLGGQAARDEVGQHGVERRQVVMGTGRGVVAGRHLEARQGAIERLHLLAVCFTEHLAHAVEPEGGVELHGRERGVRRERLGAQAEGLARHGVRLPRGGVIRLVGEDLRAAEAAVERLQSVVAMLESVDAEEVMLAADDASDERGQTPQIDVGVA